MRALLAGFALLSLVACGGHKGDDGDDGGGDACIGLECQVVNCQAQGKTTATTLTGTVFAPNGTLPLFGVHVYVPRDPPPLPPFSEGAQCDRCSSSLPGTPIVRTQTDDAGKFRIENVPVGDNIPLVITTGKWRRQITISHVEACVEAELPAVDTRLPKTRAEGEIPKVAITTGASDTLECLVRKLGVDDTEIGKAGDQRRIHFYKGNGIGAFEVGFPGGVGALPSATPFWASRDNLKAYDIVMLSCEGGQNGDTKPQGALDAMKGYADLGGRVFASHSHNIWVSGQLEPGGGIQKPAVWDTLGSWVTAASMFNGPVKIDEIGNPKGMAFANWMQNVGASPTTRSEFDVTNGRTSSVMIDPTRVERWVHQKNAGMNPQMFQFTTPVESPVNDRCGRVVFTDMHVSGQPADLTPYPTQCMGGTTLSPQEKALAFSFFDIASCVGPIL